MPRRILPSGPAESCGFSGSASGRNPDRHPAARVAFAGDDPHEAEQDLGGDILLPWVEGGVQPLRPAEEGTFDVCGGTLTTREDDTEEALAVRLREYHEKTDPVLELFARKEYVVSIDARPSKEEVQQEIRERLHLPPYKPSNDTPAPDAPAPAG